jgi:hypothetical protein
MWSQQPNGKMPLQRRLPGCTTLFFVHGAVSSCCWLPYGCCNRPRGSGLEQAIGGWAGPLLSLLLRGYSTSS